MTNQEAYTAKAQSMIYEGNIKLSAQDLLWIDGAIREARRSRPDMFDYYREVFLKIHAMNAEIEEELWCWQVKQELEEQRHQEREKHQAVELLLAQARLEYAQKRLAEAQENAA
ncbi:hypothetical protein [Pseudomonas sp. Snoq117.2]|uniref:hypothetical protein n=1 Tax=Pseudomonas sp. Snoq117.2 TaxID=1500302 RepID=UPI0008C147A5|nr:hypothetical protein [Pseudomonas sp. Snoq117.2]SEP41610.1 hypothetical protein SAMN02787149_11114 [Pseudomonas sp. Snoq117.2]